MSKGIIWDGIQHLKVFQLPTIIKAMEISEFIQGEREGERGEGKEER